MLKSYGKIILFVLAILVMTNDTVISILRHWSIMAFAGILIAVSFTALILYVRKAGAKSAPDSPFSGSDETFDKHFESIYDPESDTVPVLEFETSPPPRSEDEGEHHE